MVSKILAPLDGTEIAEAGLLWAEHAGRRSGASVHLLTVVGPDEPDVEARLKEAEAYLQSRRDQLKKKGLTVKMEVASGEPAETILERAEAVDLTVVSSGTVRWLISAVLDRVLEKMTRPLVVVRASATQAPVIPNTDKILVAVDQTNYSSDIIPVVQGLAKAFGASVTRGRDHLDSRLVGSTANAVLHSTRLPCLLARSMAAGSRFAGSRSGSAVPR
jgi:nucleotide-binding universal stress UspA family protein